MTKAGLLKSLDAGAGALICRLCGHLPALARDNEKVTIPARDDVRRLLVIRPGGMGDMIVLLPVLRALRARFPAARIDVAGETRNLEALQLARLDVDAFVYDRHPLAFLQTLHARHYDIAIDTEQFHHLSALFSLFSGAPVRIGFNINPRRNPLYTHLVNYAPDGREGEQFMRLLSPLGMGQTAYALTGILANAERSLPALAGDVLRQPAGGRGVVALHIGASTRFKRWTAERFADLAERLQTRYGRGIVLIGDHRDRRMAARVIGRTADNLEHSIFDFTGRLTWRETAAVIGKADLFVGSDSGLAHLAIALGQRTVILFGPSDHLKWGLQDERHAVVRRRLPCSPCFIFGYHKPCRSIACMRAIEVDEVVAACDNVLRAG